MKHVINQKLKKLNWNIHQISQTTEVEKPNKLAFMIDQTLKASCMWKNYMKFITFMGWYDGEGRGGCGRGGVPLSYLSNETFKQTTIPEIHISNTYFESLNIFKHK